MPAKSAGPAGCSLGQRCAAQHLSHVPGAAGPLARCAACRGDSPEAFHHEPENVAWEESLRGCAENTYLALFEVGSCGRLDQLLLRKAFSPGLLQLYMLHRLSASGITRLDLGSDQTARRPAAPQGHREAVAPVVVQLLKSASDACPPGAAAQLAAAAQQQQQQQQQNGAAAGGGGLIQGVPAAVLRKEAAYQAVAAGAYELHDYVDFTG